MGGLGAIQGEMKEGGGDERKEYDQDFSKRSAGGNGMQKGVEAVGRRVG